VQAYLIHVGDKSDTNFRKILDLKGLRKPDQATLMELFAAHKSAPRNEALPAASPFLTPLTVGTPLTTVAGIASLGAAQVGTRFEATTFGSALMTAARDGVDRFGSPTLGSASASRTGSPPPGGTTGLGHAAAEKEAGQNVRNIGKFFKRDLGAFGGRFGRGDESSK
jgi:hypothetical protein